MKLRVRSADGGPTYKIQVSFPHSLQDLKDAISAALALPPVSFRLSLNKTEDMEGPGTTPLVSLGVRNGDLLFLRTGSSSSASQCLATSSRGTSDGQDAVETSACARETEDPNSVRVLCATAADRRIAASRKSMLEADSSLPCGSGVEASEKDRGRAKGVEPRAEDMDLDPVVGEREGMLHESDADISMTPAQTRDEKFHSSIPDLLQRVLVAEADKVSERPAFMVLAVHAVMLETGFVRVEPAVRASSSSSQGTGLLNGWFRNSGIVNLQYTLPELAETRSSSRSATADVLLRCQIVGNAFIAYGIVAGSVGSEVYRLSLPVWRFLRKDTVGLVEELKGGEGTLAEGQNGRREPGLDITSSVIINVFELWKEVKDRLSLPLLTHLCEKSGLPPPPSLLLLPTELKVKILDFLPARTLATVACVCSELKFLSGSDELWKEKFRLEFGGSDSAGRAPGQRGWKTAFGREWERRKRREVERHFCAESLPTLVLRPPTFPGSIGGDYDRLPGLGGGPFFPGFGGRDRFRRDRLPAPGISGNRGPLASRLGGRIWCDLGGGLRRMGDDIGDGLDEGT